MLTEDGAVDLDVPRDRNGTLEPQIVPKGGKLGSTASTKRSSRCMPAA
jgi:hypothetical protein